MMMCSRCKKRPAAVFITAMQGSEKKNEGLCLVCAKELGIPQVKEYMEQMGLTDEDLDEFSSAVMDITDGDNFEMGGSGTLPSFIQNLLSDLPGSFKAAGEGENSEAGGKRELLKRRKTPERIRKRRVSS